MSMRFDGRVALITGAGKGLGRIYALWMAQCGAKIVVNNRVHGNQRSSAQVVVDEIRASGGEAVADGNDVQDEAGGRSMVQTALDAFGRIDVLVCNAGISQMNEPFHTTLPSRMHEIMDINFWGTVYPLYAAIPHMIQTGYGRIVMTTSQAGLYAYPGSALYGASKAALMGLARSVGAEGERHNIRANVIAPIAATRMSESLSLRIREVIDPTKVAPMVGWLCSEACHDSGMIFNVAGGRVRRIRIQEGPRQEIVNGDIDSLWPALDDTTSAAEAKNAIESAVGLVPEWLEPETAK